MSNKLFTVIAFVLISTANIFAQTSGFVYQGKLNDGTMAANGTYQFTFKMYDAAANGNQVGQTIADLPATVTNGIFSVNLDFGASSFSGATRYLEISVRLNNSGQNYTMLNPRQPIASTPYAVKSLNADNSNTATTAVNSQNLGGIPAAQYTQTNDARLSDARTPTPFSTYYIQNGTSLQASSNFNVSGEGKANTFSATTQFNIGANRVLAIGNGNLFVGFETGTNNTIGGNNSFVGAFAGQKNTTGVFNLFFGHSAGLNNKDGFRNSFFGVNAGITNSSGAENAFFGLNSGFSNMVGGSNSFFGAYSGRLTTEGNYNAFFGRSAGETNTIGSDNAFFGQGAGFNNTTGDNNTFVGQLSGLSNTTENSNTFLGYKSNGAVGITNATAIGANAIVTTSNTMVLGTNTVTVFAPGTLSGASINATNNYKIGGNRVFHLTGTDNTFVGFEAGNSINNGNFNAFFGTYAGKGTTTGFNNAFFGSYAGRDNITGGNNAFFGANAGISNNASFNAFFGSGSGFSNTSGTNNSYFGNTTGVSNSTGDNNSFFGSNAGKSVSDSSFNSFFGSFTGEKTSSGVGNSFFGTFAGRENLVGFNNTFIGYKAGQSFTNGNNNVAIGYNTSFTNGVSNSVAIGAGVSVTASNEIVIGNFSTQTTSLRAAKTYTNDIQAFDVDANAITADSLSAPIIKGTTGTLTGVMTVKELQATDYAQVNGTLKAERVTVGNASVGGSTALCGQFQGGSSVYFNVVVCSSSIRYKENVQNFARGMELINKLRPVTFNWKTDGRADVGFIAEEVNESEPLLTVFNGEGKIEGVKYAQITTALVNAVKEQNAQIITQSTENQKLQDQLKQQQMQIDQLKTIFCTTNKDAAVCQPNK